MIPNETNYHTRNPQQRSRMFQRISTELKPILCTKQSDAVLRGVGSNLNFLIRPITSFHFMFVLFFVSLFLSLLVIFFLLSSFFFVNFRHFEDKK